MLKLVRTVCCGVLLGSALSVLAGEPVVPAPDQGALLYSDDFRAAMNKRIVYDFWRKILEAGHLELAPKYLSKDYLQHNPNVPTGRDGFVDFFSQFSTPQPIQKRVKAKLVSIVAEDDLVIVSSVSEQTDPHDSSQTYTTTWFDQFRLCNGKIVEHWDSALKY